MKDNPFIPFFVTSWPIFILASIVAEFKPWAWMLWIPYLGLTTLAPIIWHFRNRLK